MKQRNHITASITTQSSWIFGAALPSCDRPYGVMPTVSGLADVCSLSDQDVRTA